MKRTKSMDDWTLTQKSPARDAQRRIGQLHQSDGPHETADWIGAATRRWTRVSDRAPQTTSRDVAFARRLVQSDTLGDGVPLRAFSETPAKGDADAVRRHARMWSALQSDPCALYAVASRIASPASIVKGSPLGPVFTVSFVRALSYQATMAVTRVDPRSPSHRPTSPPAFCTTLYRKITVGALQVLIEPADRIHTQMPFYGASFRPLVSAPDTMITIGPPMWPPTVADLVRTYVALAHPDSGAPERLTSYLTNEACHGRCVQIGVLLVEAISAAIMRCSIGNPFPMKPGFKDAFRGHSPAHGLGPAHRSDPSNDVPLYFVMETDRARHSRVFLFAVETHDGAHLVQGVCVYRDSAPSRPYALAALGDLAQVGASVRLHLRMLPDFLAALATPSAGGVYERMSVAIHGVGHVRAAMVDLPCFYDVPVSVRRALDHYNCHGHQLARWEGGRVRAAWLTEAQLGLALGLAHSHLVASVTGAALFDPRRSLADRAARRLAQRILDDHLQRARFDSKDPHSECRGGGARSTGSTDGPTHDMIGSCRVHSSTDVSVRVALYVWHLVCCGGAAPNGHLSGAPLLVDVARVLGAPYNQTAVPELLAGALVEPIISAAALLMGARPIEPPAPCLLGSPRSSLFRLALLHVTHEDPRESVSARALQLLDRGMAKLRDARGEGGNPLAPSMAHFTSILDGAFQTQRTITGDTHNRGTDRTPPVDVNGQDNKGVCTHRMAADIVTQYLHPCLTRLERDAWQSALTAGDSGGDTPNGVGKRLEDVAARFGICLTPRDIDSGACRLASRLALIMTMGA